MLIDVVAVMPLPDFLLELRYENGELRRFDRQVKEIHARVSVLYRCTQLGLNLPKLRLNLLICGALPFKSLCNKVC